jgi:hypothetical protein
MDAPEKDNFFEVSFEISGREVGRKRKTQNKFDCTTAI